MSGKFQSSVHQRDDVSYVKVTGVIDEDNELAPLADRLTGSGTAVIDLSEIERINSCGVRDWVNWLGKVEKGGSKAVLIECSPAIVAQINLVNNFTGQGVVKSFYAPYFCPNCDLEKVLLVETRDMMAPGGGPARFKAPTCRCDECDGVMDFDDMEDSYFAFLSNSKKIVTDARIDAVLTEFTPAEADGSRKLRRTGTTGPGQTPAPQSPSGATSIPSIPSIPSLARTPSGPGGFGGVTGTGQSQRFQLLEPSELSRRVVPTQPQRSAGAWILVGVLVATAIALLAYVFFAGPGKPAITPVGAVGAAPTFNHQ
jgi:anti-anti-sigma regulatory factor